MLVLIKMQVELENFTLEELVDLWILFPMVRESYQSDI